jgi:hypothetical protein
MLIMRHFQQTRWNWQRKSSVIDMDTEDFIQIRAKDEGDDSEALMIDHL